MLDIVELQFLTGCSGQKGEECKKYDFFVQHRLCGWKHEFQVAGNMVFGEI